MRRQLDMCMTVVNPLGAARCVVTFWVYTTSCANPRFSPILKCWFVYIFFLFAGVIEDITFRVTAVLSFRTYARDSLYFSNLCLPAPKVFYTQWSLWRWYRFMTVNWKMYMSEPVTWVEEIHAPFHSLLLGCQAVALHVYRLKKERRCSPFVPPSLLPWTHVTSTPESRS